MYTVTLMVKTRFRWVQGCSNGREIQFNDVLMVYIVDLDGYNEAIKHIYPSF